MSEVKPVDDVRDEKLIVTALDCRRTGFFPEIHFPYVPSYTPLKDMRGDCFQDSAWSEKGKTRSRVRGSQVVMTLGKHVTGSSLDVTEDPPCSEN
ncbi:hypothetical protein TNCV_4562301 [Trichonephila clavipes]|nr:hypothetical protein TNCV_4562301 [Trichonephila clavipes]